MGYNLTQILWQHPEPGRCFFKVCVRGGTAALCLAKSLPKNAIPQAGKPRAPRPARQTHPLATGLRSWVGAWSVGLVYSVSGWGAPGINAGVWDLTYQAVCVGHRDAHLGCAEEAVQIISV